MRVIIKRVIILFGLIFVNIEAFDSIIILSQQDTKESIDRDLAKYGDIVENNSDFKAKATIKKQSNHFILEVEPFRDTDSIVSAYLLLKESFPNAFILDKNTQQYNNVSLKDAKDDQLLWIAIFSLALIGILGLFFSSIQIKNIMRRHNQMKDKQRKIESFLTNIGENIYELTKKNIKYKSDTTKDIPPEKIVKRRDIIDKKLFDTTRVMIHFLRLKSKQVSIIHEKFNLNNLLNGVLGTISNNFEGSPIELIFEVENSVPQNLMGDPLHLSEILTELLQNAMKHTNGEVKLHVSIHSIFPSDTKLHFEISDTGDGISDRELEMLFIPRYTDEGEYKGLGLYVANELTELMNGELTIKSSSSKGTVFLCSLPLVYDKDEEKKVYKLPDDSYAKKRVLIYDNNENSSLAIKKMFNYFKIEAEVVSPQKFSSKKLEKYDIVLLDIDSLEKSTISKIREIKKKQSLKIVHLSSCFSTKRYISHDYTDDWIEKPISQERIYELLLDLFDLSTQKAKSESSATKLKIVKPDELVETRDITTNNFIDFKEHHLLIVEDNIIDQKVIRAILGKGGMEITVANNGKEGLDKLRDKNNHYDLIFMDISMPIMDGYETIKEIRSSKEFDNIPIISLTSLALDNDVSKMFRVGSNAYLRKPLKIGYLYTVLNHFLGDESINMVSINEEEESRINLYGLDIDRGIEHANGSQELYKEILEEFLTAYGNSAESLKLWIEENRYEQIKRLCLDMKGLTGAIGAYSMFEIVDTMHKQFLYNNVHLIPKFIESYEMELKKLVNTIYIYMDSIK
jgi:CheY-like chemotaxis protein/HPt (histidine-containing phosphotransfer) domain-containing protein